MGRLGVSEDVWGCLFLSLVSCVIFGCLGGVVGYLGDIEGCLSCLGVFWGVSEGSVHVGSSQAVVNPPFWPNPERQDFFHLTLLRHQNIKTSLCKLSKNH